MATTVWRMSCWSQFAPLLFGRLTSTTGCATSVFAWPPMVLASTIWAWNRESGNRPYRARTRTGTGVSSRTSAPILLGSHARCIRIKRSRRRVRQRCLRPGHWGRGPCCVYDGQGLYPLRAAIRNRPSRSLFYRQRQGKPQFGWVCFYGFGKEYRFLPLFKLLGWFSSLVDRNF